MKTTTAAAFAFAFALTLCGRPGHSGLRQGHIHIYMRYVHLCMYIYLCI